VHDAKSRPRDYQLVRRLPRGVEVHRKHILLDWSAEIHSEDETGRQEDVYTVGCEVSGKGNAMSDLSGVTVGDTLVIYKARAWNYGVKEGKHTVERVTPKFIFCGGLRFDNAGRSTQKCRHTREPLAYAKTVARDSRDRLEGEARSRLGCYPEPLGKLSDATLATIIKELETP